LSAIACALIGRGEDLEPWAAAAALALAPGRSAAAVLWWAGPSEPPGGPVRSPAPAARAARAAAAALDAVGLQPAPRGRLVWAELPPAGPAAAAAAERAAAALDGRCVLALAGARGAALERLLDGVPCVGVVAAPGGPLAGLALEGLERSGRAGHALPPAPVPAGLLARAGLLVPGGMRRALEPVLGRRP